MPYNLRNFDGRAFTTISDGVVDQQATSSLNLVGKDVVSYGTFQNDNFLWLLENFAGTIEPINKIQGQIWFDKNTNVMRPKFYDGDQWKTFAINSVQNSTPVDALVGDLWFNIDSEQLYAKGTSTFVLIGPQKLLGYGKTIWESTLVQDVDSILHPSVIAYVNDNIVGVVSTNTYNVKTSEAIYTAGITSIGKGINLVPGGRVRGDFQYTEAYSDETITGDWTFAEGITVGDFSIIPTSSDLTLDLGGNNLKITSANILPTGATSLGSTTNKFVKIFVNEINAGSSVTGVNLVGQYSLGSGSKLFPGADNTIGLGAANARWSSVFTSALSAGGSSSQGQIVGDWRLEASSVLDVTAGVLKADQISAGSSSDLGSLTGNWSLQSGSTLNVISGTFNADSIINSTGALDITVLDINSVKVNGNIVLNAANFTNYSPTKNGSGATGTWDIDINGNANTLGGRNSTYFAPIESPALIGTPTAPTAAAGTNNSQVASTAFVQTALTSALPKGSVIMWYGAVNTIPGGWALCDGSNVGGFLTPDLRNRFIVGAGSSYSIGATGGVDSVTLTSNQMPSHSHTGSTDTQSSNHTHNFSAATSSQGQHFHIFPGDDQLDNANGTAGWAAIVEAGFPYDSKSVRRGDGRLWRTTEAGTHNHTISGTTDGMSQNHAHQFATNTVGGNESHENRPPFFAIFYIIKVV
jgi:microcystin-dependent protein